MVEIPDKEYEKIQDAREIAESVIGTIREPLIILNGDLKVVSASRAFYQTFKARPEETEHRFIYDLGNNQWDIPALRKLLEGILPNNESFDNYEVEHDFPGIGKRVMLLNARRIPRPPEKARVILLAIEDVTGRKGREVIEHKRVEEKEKAAALRLEYLSKYANDFIILLDDDFKFIEINDRVVDNYGYNRDELIGMHASNLRAPETKAAFEAQVGVAKKTGKALFETVHQRKDGTKFPVEINLHTFEIEGKRLYQAIIRDTTDRKRAEEELKRNMEELKLINDVAIDREIKMIDLEKEVDDLRKELGRGPKYK